MSSSDDFAGATAICEGIRSAAARGQAPAARGDGPAGRGPNDCSSIRNLRILGIDPGTGICGFGVISGTTALDYGVIATPPHTPLPERLEDIYNSLHEIIAANHPDVIAIEKLFFKQNITTGISVAEARGVCLLVAKQHQLPIFEYSPNQIKKAICGYGQAHKPQVQEMVRIHLGLETAPQPDDAADALAVAIVHSFCQRTSP